MPHKKVAVLLSGCGVYDGSEITEVVSLFVHLSRHKVKYSCFSVDKTQLEVINHSNGNKQTDNRNVLVESARISRGDINDISKCVVDEFEALIIPGGFGVAKNLSDFAIKGGDFEIDQGVSKFITEFHTKNKPIALCCIAPVLVAKLIPGVEITLGGEENVPVGEWPSCGAVCAVKKLGAKHVDKSGKDVHVDKAKKIVTTPAFMCGTSSAHDVFVGIGAMVDAVLAL